MNEEPMSMNTLIPAMQSILSASTSEAVRGAVDTLNRHLTVIPVNLVLTQSKQFVDIVEQTLMDAIENNPEHMLPHTLRECQIALNDWKLLRRPVLPAPVMSPAARTILGIVSDIHSLGEYEVERQVLWSQLQALDDAEQETVSGHLSQKLSELLIRKTVQEMSRVKGDLQLRRQYFLWDQLAKCRQYGLEDLTVYFLQPDRDCVKVLLPPAMDFRTDAKEYYSCARTFAVLYLDFRDRLMGSVSELAENDRQIVLGVLRRKLARLLIENRKEEGGNGHFRRVYRLWKDVQTCIRNGAGEFALFYIRPVSDGARLFSPWTLSADSTVEEFYYAAAVSGDLRQSGRAWGLQAPMVAKMRKPLMQRVFRMIKNGIENEDSRALMELYAMLTWTVDGENWDYWQLKRFDQLRERYCPPNWGFGEDKEDEAAAAEGEETDTAHTEE